MSCPRWALPVGLLLLLAPVGCAGPRGPQAASSANSTTYAQAYPTRLDDALKKAEAHQNEVQQVSSTIASFPDQLKDPKKDRVLEIVQRADESGRSQSYVDTMREAEHVTLFFAEEKDELNKKIGGEVAFAAKQKGCNVDLYGATGHATGEAINKQIEKRLREHNEAHLLIERYRTELGKANATLLEKQADDISWVSYLVYIEAPESRNSIQAMVSEGEQVKRTADDAISRERAYQGEPGRTAEDKRASDARIANLTKSKAAIDPLLPRARQYLEASERRNQELRKLYEDVLGKVKDKLKR